MDTKMPIRHPMRSPLDGPFDRDGESNPPQFTGEWLLISGAWDDLGEWDDAATWNDGA